MKTVILMCMLLFAAGNVAAKSLYKCKVDGVTSYQAKPCQGGGQQIEVKESSVTKNESESFVELEPGIMVGPFVVRREEVNSFGDQWYACKVRVNNNTDSARKLYVSFKGVDKNNFEIDSVVMIGTVPAHGSEFLTNRQAMKIDKFNQINNWVLSK